MASLSGFLQPSLWNWMGSRFLWQFRTSKDVIVQMAMGFLQDWIQTWVCCPLNETLLLLSWAVTMAALCFLCFYTVLPTLKHIWDPVLTLGNIQVEIVSGKQLVHQNWLCGHIGTRQIIQVQLHNCNSPLSIAASSCAAGIGDSKWLLGTYSPLVGVSGILTAEIFVVRIEPCSQSPRCGFLLVCWDYLECWYLTPRLLCFWKSYQVSSE